MTTTAAPDARPHPADDFAERLRLPVWHCLSRRADAIRRALPPRPDDSPGRCTWWRSLTEQQARQAALLDRLNALCGHLTGRPALGYAPDDRLPLAALEEAEGFVSRPVSALISAYALTRRPPARRAPTP
ncbi:hypothetical protein ACIO3O_36945 [Streptomyces sp. NPDC087440]|uniref:hypothetical protein n=1 Tax=Streptomyces sp. NPDC087440 TaxID=3365790 RepID=UPI003830C3A5